MKNQNKAYEEKVTVEAATAAQPQSVAIEESKRKWTSYQAEVTHTQLCNNWRTTIIFPDAWTTDRCIQWLSGRDICVHAFFCTGLFGKDDSGKTTTINSIANVSPNEN